MARRGLLVLIGLTVVAAVAAPAASAQSGVDVHPPTTPKNVKVTGVTDHSASIAWDASTDVDWDPTIDREPFIQYRVYNGDEFVGLTHETRFDVTALRQNTRFTLSVEAYDRQDNRSAKAPVAATTARDVTAPIAPNFRGFSLTPQTVRLQWFAVGEQGSIMSYVVSDGTSTRVIEGHPLDFGEKTTDFPTPTPGRYTYTIRTRDDAGNLSETRSLTFDVEHVPPTAPRNLRRVSGPEDFPHEIAWDAATDNSGKPLRYRVFIGRFLVATTSSTTFNLLSIWYDPNPRIPSGRHDVTVRAVDPSANVSPPSNAIPIVIP